MGYIGNEPTTGHFPVDNLTSSGGSTYTLSKAPASVGAIEVSVQGILQPTTAYSVSGTTLTLAGVANNVNIFVRHLGETLSLPTPADGSVTTSKLAVDSVDGTKIADDAIDSDHYVDGSVDNAHLATGIDATKLTGSVPSAALGNVDLTAVRQDIAMLALYNAVSDNRAAYNLPSSFVDHFQDDTGITTQNDVSNIDEYFASVQVTGGDDSYTKMLMHMEDTALGSSAAGHNSSAVVTPSTLGACSRSNAVPAKFGAYSMGTTGGSGIKFPYLAAWNDWGAQAITVDFWYRFATYPTSPGYALFTGDVDIQYVGLRHHHPQMNAPQSYSGGGAWGANETGIFSNYVQNTWYHVAMVHNTTPSTHTVKVYINGVEDLSSNVSGACGTGSGFNIMGDWGGNYTNYPAAGCYMDEFRLSIGIARWTTDFSSALPTQAYGTTTANATGTLISDTQTAPSATTKMSGVILYKDNAGTATLGTDLVISLSADNGSNWTEAASYGAITPLFSTGVKMVRLGETTVTSGSSPVIKAVWANQASGSKETQLHGWAVNY